VLFDAIARRLDADEPIDPVLLAADVRGTSVSVVTISDMFENAGATVAVYIPLVRAARLRRALHALGACLTSRTLDAAYDPREVARWCRRQLERIDELLAGGSAR
jgi:hypothetical protein